MKLTILTALLLLTLGVKGQKRENHIRYFKYVTYFTLEGGCSASSIGTVYMIKGCLDFDIIKKLTAKWVYPDKLKTFKVGSIDEITKSEMLNRTEKFKCDTTQYHIVFTNSSISLTDSLKTK